MVKWKETIFSSSSPWTSAEINLTLWQGIFFSPFQLLYEKHFLWLLIHLSNCWNLTLFFPSCNLFSKEIDKSSEWNGL